MIFVLAIAIIAALLVTFTYKSFKEPADLVNTTIGILLCMFTALLINIYLLTLA